MSPEPVYIVPQQEYLALKADKEMLDAVYLHLTPGVRQDELKAVAQTFQFAFDPARANEWGHISYCFNKALKRLVHGDGA